VESCAGNNSVVEICKEEDQFGVKFYSVVVLSVVDCGLIRLIGYYSSTLSSFCDFRKSSKSQESQFAVFWKPVLSLDTSGW